MDNKQKLNHLAHRLADISDRYQQVGQDYLRELHDYGTGELYTSTEVHLVTRIEENPGITAVQIAETTLRSKSAVSQMLRKLEDKDLVYREKDPGNGKQYFLYVTPKGKHLSLCHKAYDEKAMPWEEMLDLFGMDGLEKFAEMMDYATKFIQSAMTKNGKTEG